MCVCVCSYLFTDRVSTYPVAVVIAFIRLGTNRVEVGNAVVRLAELGK